MNPEINKVIVTAFGTMDDSEQLSMEVSISFSKEHNLDNATLGVGDKISYTDVASHLLSNFMFTHGFLIKIEYENGDVDFRGCGRDGKFFYAPPSKDANDILARVMMDCIE